MANHPKEENAQPAKSSPRSKIMMGLLIVFWFVAFGYAFYSNAIH